MSLPGPLQKTWGCISTDVQQLSLAGFLVLADNEDVDRHAEIPAGTRMSEGGRGG